LDFVQFTNRFAGPVLRLRAAMRQVARGEAAPPLSFRDDDFWQELAADFNRIAARLSNESKRPAAAAKREVEESDELVLTATD
jgi:nitrogen fixation/metabolism regulation signal transduction histidine kinase